MAERKIPISDDVEQMLNEGTTKLRPQDWKSGDNAWVLPEASTHGVLKACFQHDEIIAPFGGVLPEAGNKRDEMVKDIKKKVFADRELKYLSVEDGVRKVKVA